MFFFSFFSVVSLGFRTVPVRWCLEMLLVYGIREEKIIFAHCLSDMKSSLFHIHSEAVLTLQCSATCDTGQCM